MFWLWATAAMAGKRALARAALGAVALPGGVVVESGAPWGAAPAGEQGPAGTATLQDVHALASRCFGPRLTVDPLSGEPTGWRVVIDVVAGPVPVMGLPLVDGIVADDEIACLEAGLSDVASPAGAVGLTVRVASAGPLLPVGDARVSVDPPVEHGDSPASRRAVRFERRAEEVALACARAVGPPPSGQFVGAGTAVFGAPEDFAACWAERAGALEAWTTGSEGFRLRYTQ